MIYIFRPHQTVILFVSPQLLLQYLMQGLETCYTVQTCIGHVHEGNGRVGRKPSETDSIKFKIPSKTPRVKKPAQKDTIIDITSDSQVNSNFPYRWSPASLTFNNWRFDQGHYCRIMSLSPYTTYMFTFCHHLLIQFHITSQLFWIRR